MYCEPIWIVNLSYGSAKQQSGNQQAKMKKQKDQLKQGEFDFQTQINSKHYTVLLYLV